MRKIAAVLLAVVFAVTPCASQRQEVPLPYQYFLIIDVDATVVPDPITIVPRQPFGWARGIDERDVVERVITHGTFPDTGHAFVALQWPYRRTPQLPTIDTGI